MDSAFALNFYYVLMGVLGVALMSGLALHFKCILFSVKVKDKW